MRESNVSTFLSGKDNTNSSAGNGVNLYFHSYTYFPYEKELARREVRKVACVSKFTETAGCIRLPVDVDTRNLRRLTYIARVVSAQGRFSTIQNELEESHRRVAGIGRRQATRYSVHGLHEYKGRFNPQIVRFLLNYFGATKRMKTLDPFCGSGTTLVEAAFQGMTAVGVDMNPLAAFLSNAKLRALETPAREIQEALQAVLRSLRRTRRRRISQTDDTRLAYLQKWFPAETLALIESVRTSIREHGGRAEPVLLALASDLLRSHSLQEPSDLRIRRRISPFPEESLLTALEIKAAAFIRSLGEAQEVTGLLMLDSEAVVEDSRELPKALERKSLPSRYELVITSPPYATALPYIDTQRLSLVWLGLCCAEEIRRLDADAVGSREIRSETTDWRTRLADNADNLPPQLASLCRKLQTSLSSKDGFRRQAVPTLIYRYFADMHRAFVGLAGVLSQNAKLAFVVGSNHTTLGGRRFDINTPDALGLIAGAVGFCVKEVISLQAYQRYGLHQKNSIRGESLTIMEWPKG